MATGWKGLAVGALGLAALQVAVGGDTPAAQKASASRVGGLFDAAGRLAQKFLNPDVPIFAKPLPATSSSTTTGTTAIKPAVSTTTTTTTNPFPAGTLLPGSQEVTA